MGGPVHATSAIRWESIVGSGRRHFYPSDGIIRAAVRTRTGSRSLQINIRYVEMYPNDFQTCPLNVQWHQGLIALFKDSDIIQVIAELELKTVNINIIRLRPLGGLLPDQGLSVRRLLASSEIGEKGDIVLRVPDSFFADYIGHEKAAIIHEIDHLRETVEFPNEFKYRDLKKNDGTTDGIVENSFIRALTDCRLAHRQVQLWGHGQWARENADSGLTALFKRNPIIESGQQKYRMFEVALYYVVPFMFAPDFEEREQNVRRRCAEQSISPKAIETGFMLGKEIGAFFLLQSPGRAQTERIMRLIVEWALNNNRVSSWLLGKLISLSVPRSLAPSL